MNILIIIAYVIVGMMLGGMFFALLMGNVRMLTEQTASLWPFMLYATRFGLAIGGFWLVAQQGAVPLVSCLIGFLFGRTIVQLWLKKVG